MKAFLKCCEDLGLEIITLHTSGHADPDTIKELIGHTNPTKIIPIHTENADWFVKEYGDKIIIE
ncbi:MAG: MBL fold metallo-hydrolase RNA specificity domain-containing protein [Syntrophomonadaceae bacterium]|nr:MBL fold metallo-hydrolase RNA specificity domain-containing protein [Syntrophomonadaceae bacterium]